MKETFYLYVSVPIGIMALFFIHFTILNILHIRRIIKENKKKETQYIDKIMLVNNEIKKKFKQL